MVETHRSVLKPIRVTLPLPPLLNKLYRRNPYGGMYKDPKAKVWETEVYYLLANYQPTDGDWSLKATFYYRNTRTDVDAGLKALQDCFEGKVYHNDNQLAEIHLRREVDKTQPRVEVELTRL